MIPKLGRVSRRRQTTTPSGGRVDLVITETCRNNPERGVQTLSFETRGRLLSHCGIQGAAAAQPARLHSVPQARDSPEPPLSRRVLEGAGQVLILINGRRASSESRWRGCSFHTFLTLIGESHGGAGPKLADNRSTNSRTLADTWRAVGKAAWIARSEVL